MLDPTMKDAGRGGTGSESISYKCSGKWNCASVTSFTTDVRYESKVKVGEVKVDIEQSGGMPCESPRPK